ncbi:MAG: hypothetical protein NC248_12275 [Bacteroides sp.]|nr:hypothetical protein [Bacteroides sp.]MCM1391104.1 hypothetical protein [Bacteroides sp.]
MAQILKNIIRLEAVDPAALARFVIVPGYGAYGAAILGEELPLVAPAEAHDVTKTVDRTKVHTVTLTAKLTRVVNTLSGKPVCYIITTASGSRLLIGTFDAPYPITDTDEAFPSKPSESSAVTLTVQYTSTHGILELKES